MGWVDSNTNSNQPVCLVAYNGSSFDFPFLFACCERYAVEISKNIIYTVDPIEIIRGIKLDPIPMDKKLGTIYTYITGETLLNAHSAAVDVKALITILLHPPIWEKRVLFIKNRDNNKKLSSNLKEVIDAKNNSSSTTNKPAELFTMMSHNIDGFDHGEFQEVELDERVLKEQVEDDGSDDEIHVEPKRKKKKTPNNIEKTPARRGRKSVYHEGWCPDTPFAGICDLNEQFLHHRKSVVPSPSKTRLQFNKDGVILRRLGSQVPPIKTSTPFRSWCQVFSAPIRNIVINHTNDYAKCIIPNWLILTDREFLDFVSVLFIAAVKQRRDGPMQWFSTNPLLGDECIRRLMDRKRFIEIIKGLHISSMNNAQGHEAGYSPMLKVGEFKEALELRFRSLYEPGRNLSVDETLLRAYGRIKFKVRVITKAARYGIKMYVVTDSIDEYVLRTSMYTGGDHDTGLVGSADATLKKTTNVVLDLLEPYFGTYRSVKTDRYYTSIELAIEMDKRQLYNTGTVMNNRICKDLRWNAQKARKMERGEYNRHLYQYKNDIGQEKV